MQRFSLSRNHYVLKNCRNPVYGSGPLTLAGDNPVVLSLDVDTCIRVGIESTVAVDAIAIDTTKNSLFSGGA